MFIPSFCCKFTGRCAKISTTKDNTLINDDINLPSVRLIDEDGKPLGIVTSEQAKELAYEKNLDLVLIAPQADPPVCRIMDYGKFRFDKIKKEKESRKKQHIMRRIIFLSQNVSLMRTVQLIIRRIRMEK